MKPISRRTKLLALALFLANVALGGWYWRFHHIPEYTPKQMDTFSTHMRTHCVGRYLIDLPEDMGSPRLAYSTFYFGLDADFESVEVQMPERELIDHDRFSVLVTQRRNELRDATNDDMKISMLLKQEIVATENGDALLLRYLEDRNYRSSGIQSELHVFVKGRYLVLQANSYVNYDKLPGGRSNTSSDYYKFTDPEPAEAHLKKMGRALEHVAEADRAGPGFCIGNVLFPQPAIGYDEEKATFTFGKNVGESASLRLTVSMKGKYGYPKRPLFERMDTAASLPDADDADDFQFREVFRRRITRDGVSFQEGAAQGYWRRDRESQFNFQLQNTRPEDESMLSFERPAILLEMEAGSFGARHSPSPYRQDDLQRAWNQWVGSLRLSPGNGGARR
ncbi:T6SS immunity protein Tli4 family protein [Variovorax sp. VNK109]|uniref:T6SS immunity protein Tli4 family protein n=1 Tax=Variovorax sp. VNK109 TaxID=3400919 RepID=UPI003C0E0331